MQTQSSFEIGEFQFDPSTGELTDRGSGDAASRLPPQPAKLLKMLVDKCPEVVTRDEIQASLWPGIRTDFDKNLHFCVRQVRSAFGDSASKPDYVETIPRRGYRLIAQVRELPPADNDAVQKPGVSEKELNPGFHQKSVKDAPADTDSVEKPKQQISKKSPRQTGGVFFNSLFVWGGFAIAVVVLVYAAIQLANPTANSDSNGIEKTRVAIMPFKTEKVGFEPMGNGEIGVSLLELFSPDMEEIDLIGPTTTETFLVEKKSLRAMAEQTKVDFIVNGKYLSIEEQNRVLVEIIRARDGSHVWVKSFGPSTGNREIARLTSVALREQISEMGAGLDCDE